MADGNGRTICREELGGVPVFWSKTEGPFVAGVTFRVGISDEQIPHAGITHMVEHLAMFKAMRPGIVANGFVDRLRTLFVVQGTEEEVVSFLHQLFASLRSLPLDRLDLERQVLLTEAGSSSAHWIDTHLLLRHGPAGQGLGNYSHVGLRNLTAEEVANWAKRFFVLENAAIWMTRPPPPSLQVSLPHGERNITHAQPELNGLRLPAVAEGFPNLVSISSVVERSFAANLAAGVFGYQIFDTLRKDLGLTYHPQVVYEPLTADLATVGFACDCLEQNQKQVWTDLAALLKTSAREGPDEDDIQVIKKQASDAFLDPSAVPPLDPSAVNHLLGSRVYQQEELLQGVQRVTRDEIRSVFEELLSHALLLSPLPLQETPDSALTLNEYQVESRSPVTGKTYRLVGNIAKKSRTTAGPAGVTVTKDGESITVAFDDCLGVFREGDGTHHLLARNGDFVKVRIPRLKDGDELLALIERSVDQASIVPLDDEAGVWRRLEAAMQRDLKRRWVVWEESERASAILDANAEIIKVAEASVRLKAGLLILTDSQIVFIATTSGDGPDMTRVHELNDIEDARVGGIGKRDALVLRIAGKKHIFREISPVARNRELLEEIKGRRGGKAETPSSANT